MRLRFYTRHVRCIVRVDVQTISDETATEKLPTDFCASRKYPCGNILRYSGMREVSIANLCIAMSRKLRELHF